MHFSESHLTFNDIRIENSKRHLKVPKCSNGKIYCLHWKLLNAKIYCLPFRRDQLQVMKMQSASVNYNSLLRMRRRLNFEIVWKAIKKDPVLNAENIKADMGE